MAGLTGGFVQMIFQRISELFEGGLGLLGAVWDFLVVVDVLGTSWLVMFADKIDA